MENICLDLLNRCLNGNPWSPEMLDQAIAVDDGRAILSIVVERLADLFDPRLDGVYTSLFTEVIARAAPELNSRTRRTVTNAAAPDSAKRIYVLSRVTLGADVAVTSVLMDAAKKRYPEAEIFFVGPRKNFEMFEADPRVRHFPAPYARDGSLRERLRASAAFWVDDGIVLDPDSRISQLGLITVCPDHLYFHFNSRGYGGYGMDPLSGLTAQWIEKLLGVADAQPYIAPKPAVDTPAEITVSLGVGENTAKRIDNTFEQQLFKLLAATGRSVLVDLGGSPEEHARVTAALQPGMHTHAGAFAPFAAQVMRSKLFIGYDSAAGHVASACGVPLISVARGFANQRMAARWRPTGHVLNGDDPDILDQIQTQLDRLSPPSNYL